MVVMLFIIIIHLSLYYHTNKLNKREKRVINLHQNPFISFIQMYTKELLVRSENKMPPVSFTRLVSSTDDDNKHLHTFEIKT